MKLTLNHDDNKVTIHSETWKEKPEKQPQGNNVVTEHVRTRPYNKHAHPYICTVSVITQLDNFTAAFQNQKATG